MLYKKKLNFRAEKKYRCIECGVALAHNKEELVEIQEMKLSGPKRMSNLYRTVEQLGRLKG